MTRPDVSAAADQLAATTRDQLPDQVMVAREVASICGTPAEAVAAMTVHYHSLPIGMVAPLLAAAVLRLAELEDSR